MAEAEEETGDELHTEVSEELLAEGARLFADAVNELSAQDLDRMLRALPPAISTEVVSSLIGSKLDPRRLKNLGSLLVNSLRKRPLPRQAVLVERLSTGVLATFETELGAERFENPSLDDLREVIDTVLDEHPAAGVRCTLSWVVAGGMPAAEAARDILLTDERLRLPGWTEPS